MLIEGVYGIRKDGKDKLIYNLGDSGPDGLGQAIVIELCRYTINQIVDIYNSNEENEEENLFIKNSLKCQWGYIINLDNNTLEVWKGKQKKLDKTNRYGIEQNNGYYPCKMIATFNLNEINRNFILTEKLKDINKNNKKLLSLLKIIKNMFIK